ncbi:receptor-like protein 12 [Pyrus ussuriensis x Pyrus communis]|uniref:Receptor-like protein 12 n=1 Tax=Pyrus ussuriensis x Pyrus communis TaxID=2448454 RepID=A0A5N5F0P6_9ROSA|nr:receptor-like protein 12 [Pyrus ussuriensis x Pyrus communis]
MRGEGEGEGIRCFKLFHASIFAVLILLQCCNHSLSLDFNNISSGVVGHWDIAKVPKVIQCIQREKEALLAFKRDVVDYDSILSSWGSEAQKQECCIWEGVYCDKYTSHVVKLDLLGSSLGGRLSSQVGNLTHLQYLDLSFNDFASVENLNSWLPRLSSLTYLGLSSSNLSNSYDWLEAINMLPKLTNLSLAGCGLPSPLIHSSTLFNINSSKSLAHVDLISNQLTSSIFLWLSNYNASLVHLDLTDNQLVGSIPHVLGNMSSLVHLGLSYNQLVGSIPHVLGNLSSLAILDLSGNQIEGGIPQSFSKLCNLQELDLFNNTLSGQLSWLLQISMSACPDQNSLETLHLGMNALEGVVSESHFSNLSRLTILDLSSNSLALSFNSNWVPPFQLKFILLGSCKMGPHFPKWLQTQKNYRILDISNTGISDILPSWLWEMMSHYPEYILIDLSNNQIRGIIPNSRFEFPSYSFTRVNLSKNQLEGPIPSFLSKATLLDLSNNKLSGLISFLCPDKVSNLTYLDLSSNNLHVQIPNCWTNFANLAILDLSNNALFGKIPTTIGSLFSIQTLKLNKNRFVGELPSSLKNCTSLVVFDVGENNLSGLIPEWLGVELPKLAILIFRSNHFYGNIPLQLCNLKQIQILDLSINHISGSIPKCFNNLTKLTEIGKANLTVHHEYGGTLTMFFGNRVYEDKASLIWKGVMSEYKSTLGLVKSIHLSSNQLTGEIPNEIADLVGLVSLNLSRNNLTGQITPEIGKLQSLDSLDLSNNQIHGFSLGGRLSSQVGNLTHLQYLDLSGNEFASVENLNSWLPRLSSLTYLGLSLNNLSNSYDWLEAINMLPKLTNLSLIGCGLPAPLIHSSTLFNINSSKSLAHVDLFSNQLTSSIFLWLSNYNASLVHLDLSFNQLVGSIPHVLGNMSSLVVLHLFENQLVGSIPYVLGNLSSLAILDLSGNQIEGGIPQSFSKLCNLQTLDLSYNTLEGVVSESHFSNLSKLTFLRLSSNSLALSFNSNWVPPFQLELIHLGSCKMGPHFPKWLQTQKNYRSLDISNTGISDILPSWLWEMMSHYPEKTDILPIWLWEMMSHYPEKTASVYINLSNNQIRGIIPNSRFEFPSSSFTEVNLSKNQLEGPIPSFLSKASLLDLSNNKLSGLISFLCPDKVSNLTYLDLSSNNLHVQIPNCWTNFANLAFLDLSNNALFGKIPTTMGSLFSIHTLKLNKNRCVGELPSSLKNCTSLVVFDVGENNLSGLIPEWLGVELPKLAILILRSNHFYGNIPLQLCNLKQIQILDLSINHISGSIPKCFNNLTKLTEIGKANLTVHLEIGSTYMGLTLYSVYEDKASLIWKGVMSEYKSTLGLVKSIHLSSNQLTGEIPNEIADLVGLVSLNLSRNNLTGQITPEIGKLQSLDSLDLSNNQIHGTIPTSLFQISGLGKLDLSNNNLFGRIPMGTQLQNYEPSAFAGNPLLCGIPLQQLCSPKETSTEEPPVFRDQVEDNDGFITPGFFVSLALGFVVGFWGVCGSLMFIRSWRYTYFKFLNCVYDWLYVRVALIRRRRIVYG